MIISVTNDIYLKTKFTLNIGKLNIMVDFN